MSVVTVVASNLRRGMAIKYKGDSGILLEVEHRSPGKGAGFVQVIMRSFASGKSKDLRFAASEKAEIIQTDRQKLEFSYSDPSGIYFMDTTTYETVELPKELLSDYDGMLIENLVCEVLFVEGKPVSVELPPSIELLVTEAPEGLKGDTANNPTKAAKMETGLEDLRGLPGAIRSAGEKGLKITRFKGLGEMNAEELRETTLDPANRTLLKVNLTDAGTADEMFRLLMGDKVEPRREFIEKHALDARNLDI